MLTILGTLVVCVLVADFLTGLTHWAEDTYCLDGYPIIGKLICEPNIDHHLDPQLMVRTGSFISRNTISWILTGSVYLVLWVIGWGSWPVLVTLVIASFGNEVHRWNHLYECNAFQQFFKDSGLIQSQRQHQLHHKPPFTQYYCVLTSCCNAVLERLNFWRRLEWLIGLTGLEPTRNNRRDSNMGK